MVLGFDSRMPIGTIIILFTIASSLVMVSDFTFITAQSNNQTKCPDGQFPVLDNNGNPILNATHQPVCKPAPADAFGKAFNPNG